jgi:hypothetical protein
MLLRKLLTVYSVPLFAYVNIATSPAVLLSQEFCTLKYNALQGLKRFVAVSFYLSRNNGFLNWNI